PDSGEKRTSPEVRTVPKSCRNRCGAELFRVVPTSEIFSYLVQRADQLQTSRNPRATRRSLSQGMMTAGRACRLNEAGHGRNILQAAEVMISLVRFNGCCHE